MLNRTTNNIDLMLGNGDGTFKPGVSYPFADPGRFLATTGDFNKDGKPDLIAVGRPPASNKAVLFLLFGMGDGTFASSRSLTVEPPLDNLAIDMQGLTSGDLNQDGNPDLIVLTSLGLMIYLNPGDGSFTQHSNYTPPLYSGEFTSGVEISI